MRFHLSNILNIRLHNFSVGSTVERSANSGDALRNISFRRWVTCSLLKTESLPRLALPPKSKAASMWQADTTSTGSTMTNAFLKGTRDLKFKSNRQRAKHEM